MKLAVMQPYFFPYLGYWQMMNMVDKYVVYDDVNYIKRGWINRNAVLLNGCAKNINLILRGASQNKLIREVEVDTQPGVQNKLLRTIEQNYKKAPYFNDVYPILEDIILHQETNLAEYLYYSFQKINEYLGITTELILSSQLDKDCSLRAEAKILAICKELGATEYYNSINGVPLYEPHRAEFEEAGVELKFLRMRQTEYPQFHNEFVPNLSIIDVMMFNSREECQKLLQEYDIVTGADLKREEAAVEKNEFADKTLLVLGDSVSSSEIIEIAKGLGARTIATDYLDDSDFKKIADKSYKISTDDIDGLAAMAEKEHVTGVLAGASEFNIDKAITLSERLGTPFYATREQWDTLSDKETFKNLCRKFEVPVVDEYAYGPGVEKELRYPVIVKPVDSCAGRGIRVCHNEAEFKAGCEYALSFSPSKRLVIERYMTGDEVVIYYTLQDGYISLSAMCDRYTLKQEGVAPLPTAYVFPSRYLENFQKYDDRNIRKMFSSLGMKNGFLFLQAFVEDGRVRIYEMGYRIAGAQGHKVLMGVNGINPLEMLVRFSLGAGMSGWDLRTQDNPNFSKWACKLTPILKMGTIREITGLDEIAAMPGVTDIVPVHTTGDVISSCGTLMQLLNRIYLVADTKEKLADRIRSIQSTLHVYDQDGNDMLTGQFDPDLM